VLLSRQAKILFVLNVELGANQEERTITNRSLVDESGKKARRIIFAGLCWVALMERSTNHSELYRSIKPDTLQIPSRIRKQWMKKSVQNTNITELFSLYIKLFE